MRQPFDNLVEFVICMNTNATDREGAYKKNEIFLTEKEMLKLYKKVTDKLIIKIFERNIENELLNVAFWKLSSMQRKVLLFNVLYDFSAESAAHLLGTTVDSIYTQKYKALKRLKAALVGMDQDDNQK